MGKFMQEYKRLNPQQALAVETIEGPVMVVAGPGTGKTQVLAMRAMNILKKTHARPSNILCLTFSNAGTTAMRDRLRELIGADAYGVTVSTVHGFCDAIIQRNPMVFSDWSAKKSIADLEQYKTMQRIVDDVSSASALINPKNPYERIPAILGRISDCKREGKTLTDLLAAAEEYDALMASKSRKGTKAAQKNILQARRFRAFVDLFRRYQDVLTEESFYDYDDMILTVLKALGEEDWLLASLQERYQYILVDEAQDLNGAQWRVIERLTTYETVPHEPNFFLVGDDDQSIYRFQGANLEHMLQFRERFPGAPVIVLSTNYRSTQSILDAAGRLIAQNEERLIGRIPGLQKDLKAFTEEKGGMPILLRPPSDTAEPWLIADMIEERIKQGIPSEEIAVLVQTNRELRPIYDVLRARNLPVILQGKSDLFAEPIVLQAVTILRSLESHIDSAFVHALACDCLGCHPADIARLIAAARAGKQRVSELILHLEASKERFTDRDALIRARDTLLDLRQKKESRTVLGTLENLLRECGIIAAAADDPLDLAVIEAFFQYVKDRCLDHPSLTLREFLHDLQFYADEDFGQIRLTYQLPHLVISGVQLLTAHQSKGLEFHTVILSGFREGHWDERRNPSSLAIPEDLLFGWETEQKRFEKHQDERRVAYVAMTRAKRELLMLCPKEFSVGERARTVSPSAFFAEAGPLPERDAALKTPEQSSLLLLQPRREMDAELRAYLLERITSFALSPSSLAKFLDDPHGFRRIHLLGQPEELKEDSLRAFGYGSAVHWALREWALARQQDRDFSEEQFLAAFEWNLVNRTILTERQQKDLISQARDALPKYFAARLAGRMPVIHAVEREYRVMLSSPMRSGSAGTDPSRSGRAVIDIPLKGKIDRIDRVSEPSADAVVIDYKTGRAKSLLEIRGGLDPGKVSRTNDGDHFRQLVFYALLLESAEPLLLPQAFSLEFIGERGEDPVTRQFEVTESEKEDLRGLIRQVWGKITALDFTSLFSLVAVSFLCSFSSVQASGLLLTVDTEAFATEIPETLSVVDYTEGEVIVLSSGHRPGADIPSEPQELRYEHHGHGTKRLMAIADALAPDTAPVVSSQDSFSEAERHVLCLMSKVQIERSEAITQWLASLLSERLGRPAQLIEDALEKKHFCDAPIRIEPAHSQLTMIHLSNDGIVLSDNPVWDACISGGPISKNLIMHNRDTFEHRQGHVHAQIPYTCRDYHRGNSAVWHHPDFPDLEVTLDDRGRLLGALPVGYSAVRETVSVVGK